MKKIVCYGIKNRDLRRKVKLFLSDEYEVIGYGDTFLNEDTLQGDCYVSFSDILKLEYDYILILCADNTRQEEIRKKLVDSGVMPQKIVVPRLLFNQEALFIPDLKEDIAEKLANKFDGVILGLSYSLRGLDISKLTKRFIDFSWHGLDIYYNWLSLNYFIENYKNEIKDALLVFPYYYFNYDMSSSLYQYDTGQILSLHSYNDWHNAENCMNDKIRDYLICFEIFGMKFWKQVQWKKYCAKNINTIDKKFVELSRVWKENYRNTQEENYEIMKKILTALKEKNAAVSIIIPPILRNYISETNLPYYDLTKKNFYTFLDELKSEYDFRIIDYSEVFDKRPEFFYDYEHLNENGRQEFSKIINEILI